MVWIFPYVVAFKLIQSVSIFTILGSRERSNSVKYAFFFKLGWTNMVALGKFEYILNPPKLFSHEENIFIKNFEKRVEGFSHQNFQWGFT